MLQHQQSNAEKKEARRIYLENQLLHLKQVAERTRKDKSKSPKKSFCDDFLKGITFE